MAGLDRVVVGKEADLEAHNRRPFDLQDYTYHSHGDARIMRTKNRLQELDRQDRARARSAATLCRLSFLLSFHEDKSLP